jgi:hypothetical protein
MLGVDHAHLANEFGGRHMLASVSLVVLAALLRVAVDAHAHSDPLPSWNDGAAEQAILAFAKATTDQTVNRRSA